MAKAVHALQTKQVNRIILTRPAVEAGERLGFLPGTLSEKIDRTCGRCMTLCTT
ncbi:phoH-like family protein [Mycobacterium ulcerans str. Harvey]|uniref:PhoH-like protein n=1 Tax=Mycobacterium ulcerans str. Harvey TaxID=1299332 RepID=A0ABN0QSH2_MYCUL|nr:phoH-like family protein [Mycobacterium ulcerans str. Harvey]